MSTPFDLEVEALRKLPANRQCPNCKMDGGMFGFKNVCSKYGTFVCDFCKAGHQGLSLIHI